MKNYCYIDGQNLYLGTTKSGSPWKVDLVRFREYLRKKYHVEKAYYFLGFVNEDHRDLYRDIQEAGFVLMFREHHKSMLGKKKGNVDTDLVFNIMRSLYLDDDFDQVVLVSGDGDYKVVIDFLISENKFAKILFPNKTFASSLYKSLGSEFFDYLENVKQKIS